MVWTKSFFDYFRTSAVEPSMFIQNVVTVFDVLIIFGFRGRERKDWIVTVRHFIGLQLSLVLMNGIWQVAFDAPCSYFITHFILFLVYALWNKTGHYKQIFICVSLFYGIEIGMINLSSTFPMALGKIAIGGTLEIVLRNVTVILTVIVAMYFRRFNILQLRNIPKMSITYSVLVSCVVSILSIWYQANKSELGVLGNQLALLALISFQLIVLMAYYLNYAVCMYNNETLNLQAENLFARNDEEILKISQQNLEEIRRIRHDIRNHFAYMNMMVREERYEELVRYFEELELNIVQPLSRIDCGNRNISAILNLEASKANALGIKLDCRVIVSPHLQFQDNDLCGLLTNLIDNALEACERFALENAVVEVGINQKPHMLYISVLNPIDDSVDKSQLLLLQTKKPLPQQHGFGSRIIDMIVKKYNGEINRSIHQEKYIVDIILDIDWDEEESDGKVSDSSM